MKAILRRRPRPSPSGRTSRIRSMFRLVSRTNSRKQGWLRLPYMTYSAARLHHWQKDTMSQALTKLYGMGMTAQESRFHRERIFTGSAWENVKSRGK